MTEPRAAHHGEGALFRGAARLGVLAGGLRLPWQELAPLVAAFPAELRDELEAGVCVGTPPLWIRTRGDGEAMTFRVAHFLEARGVAEPALRRLLVTARHQGHRHLLLESGLDARGFAAWRWLLRHPLGLDETRAWLAADGADIDTLARVGLVAEALHRERSHAVGERVDRDGAVHHQVVFTLPATGASWPRLLLALERAGLDADLRSHVDRLAPQLAERDSRIVLDSTATKPGLSVQLDVDGVPLDRVRALLERGAVQTGAASTDADARLRLLASFAPRGVFDRTTLTLTAGGIRDLTVWLETTPPTG